MALSAADALSPPGLKHKAIATLRAAEESFIQQWAPFGIFADDPLPSLHPMPHSIPMSPPIHMPHTGPVQAETVSDREEASKATPAQSTSAAKWYAAAVERVAAAQRSQGAA